MNTTNKLDALKKLLDCVQTDNLSGQPVITWIRTIWPDLADDIHAIKSRNSIFDWVEKIVNDESVDAVMNVFYDTNYHFHIRILHISELNNVWTVELSVMDHIYSGASYSLATAWFIAILEILIAKELELIEKV